MNSNTLRSRFVWIGNEWLIAYACMPFGVTSPTLFSIGHAVELYLKAANAKLTGDVNRAVNFGHQIQNLLVDCRALNSDFMSNYVLRESVLQADVFSGQGLEKLDLEDQKHFVLHQTLYLAALALPDLKYFGSFHKKLVGQVSVAFCYPDPYWVDFFRVLRAFLGKDVCPTGDVFEQLVDPNDLSPRAADFLQSLSR